MEGDLWEFYRIDIRDLWTGRLSPRRARVFIERALDEPSSRIRRDTLGDDWLFYGRMAARLDDLADLLNFQTQATAVNSKAKLRHPVERPQLRKAEPKKFTAENAMAMVAMFQ